MNETKKEVPQYLVVENCEPIKRVGEERICSFDMDNCSETDPEFMIGDRHICADCLVDLFYEELEMLRERLAEKEMGLNQMMTKGTIINRKGFAPCPFCGAFDDEAMVIHIDDEGKHTEGYYCACVYCDAMGPITRLSETGDRDTARMDAMDIWNRRNYNPSINGKKV
jgi:Lar family restriction alleviation protein